MMVLSLICTIYIFFIGAATAFAEGLVPCGGAGEPACNLCHFFQLADNLIDFVLTAIVPPLAAILFIWGGIMLLLAQGNPEKIGKAKEILINVVIGLLIVYTSFLLISTLLVNLAGSMSEAETYFQLQQGFFEINCNP